MQQELGSVECPLTLGHEGVGIVTEIGNLVQRFKVGDRIGTAWLGESCTHCVLCKNGRFNLCEAQKQTGFRRQGTFAEYFVVDERFAAAIPEHLNVAHVAPMLCAGVTSFRALQRLDVPPGSRIVISGAGGGLGHVALQLAKASSLEVVALGLFNENEEAKIRNMGADYVVSVTPDTSNDEVAHRVTQYCTEDHPLVGALVLAPVASAVAAATLYVSPGGTIVTVILPKQPLTLDLVTFTLKELTLRSSIVGTPGDLQAAIDLMAKGKIETFVEERPLEFAPEALKLLSQGKVSGRIVLKISDP